VHCVLGPGRTHSRAEGRLIDDRGTVALASIPVLEDLTATDVERDPLVERVVRAFTAISATNLETILKRISGEVEEVMPDASHLSERDLAELGRRWRAGEPAQALAREAHMTITGLQKALGHGG
jgi:hypothetical protein